MTTDGRVEVECEACASGLRPIVRAIEPEDSEPVPAVPRRAWLGAAASIAAIALLSLLGASTGAPPGSASAAVHRPDGWDEVVVPDEPHELGEKVEPSITDVELIARGAASLDRRAEPPPIPTRDGEPLDEWLPTLQVWVHPVPGSPDVIPTKSTRVFGAHRDEGSIRDECGEGHCGVDLEGERGQDVVAVAWGTVVRIQHDDDRRGGRYVKIEHPDFVYTSYFHLDEIDPDLEVGMEVEPGTPLGTLGASGIQISMPHLHFALEIVDKGRLTFIDPVPFLFRAEILPRH